MRPSLALPGALALGAVALTAAANGGYFPQEWGWPALSFALVAILVALVGERLALGRLEVAFVGALAAFAAWTLLSVAWAPSATEPVLSFERVLVYALFALAASVLTSRASVPFLLAGVSAAATGVCVYALVTRPGGGEQLSGPIGYWNGLGALAAIGIVLGLAGILESRSTRVRVAAALTLPVLFAVLYLTYSRGSWLAAAAGGVVLVVAGSVPRRVVVGLGAAAALGLIAVVVAAGGPVALVHRVSSSFTAPLPATGGDLARRLGSLSSNGRSDYWRVASRETAAHPALGGGAGSYERWWHLLRRTPYEARNAHSLYLETLAELGPIGLALLGVAFALPFAALARSRSPAAVAGAAAWAVFVAHAALDWDWQLPAVVLAALACGTAPLVSARPSGEGRPWTSRVRSAWVALLLPLAAAAIVVQVGNSALAGSEAAANRDDPTAAARLARRAHAWAPWSAQPWQRLAEARLLQGDAAAAARSYRRALRLDSTDWSLWAGLAEAETGRARARAAAEAHRLNPLG